MSWGQAGGTDAEYPKYSLAEAPPTQSPAHVVAVGVSLLLTIIREFPKIGGYRCGFIAIVFAAANSVGVTTIGLSVSSQTTPVLMISAPFADAVWKTTEAVN